MPAKIRLIDGKHKGRERRTPHGFWTVCATQLTIVFSEIIGDLELLEKCYCPIRSRDFDEEFITEITTNIPTAVICSKNIQPDEFLRDNLPSNNYKQPFLIINDVGTGKSTYIHYHFLFRLSKYNLNDKIEGLLINLKEFGDEKNTPYEKIEDFIHNKIHDILITKHPEISSPNIENAIKIFDYELIPYAGVIQYKKQKANGDYENFIINMIEFFVKNIKLFNKARIRYLTRQGKRVFVVIDNVDHYGLELQEKIFRLSTQLINELKVGVIMSARDYTLPFAFRHISLSAFEPRFLHLALPDTKGIMQKRISFLFEKDYIERIFTTLGKDQIKVYSASGSYYIFDKSTLKKELMSILEALLSDTMIESMLEELSDFDMRAMLKMVRIALSSGYIYPEDRENKDKIRPNDFLRAIMCGNNPYYFPDDPSNMILNLFDDGQPEYENNNLIRLRILQAIKVFGDKASVGDVLTFLASLNFQKNNIINVLNKLMQWDLIESAYYEGSNIERDNIQTLKLTFAGHYYLNNLIFNPIYLQEIKDATFIDTDLYEKMEAFMNDGYKAKKKWERIFSRLQATKVFIEFLQREEEREGKGIQNMGQPQSSINYEKIEKITPKIARTYDEYYKELLSRI